MTDFKIIVVSMAVISMATLVTFIFIIAKVMVSIEIDDEGQRRWDGRDAEEYGVLVFAGIFMMVTLAFLAAMVFKLFQSPTNFRVGVLGGSTAMYANMTLLCCFYFISFETKENEQRRRRLVDNNYYYYQEDETEDEMEEGRMQKIMSTASFIFALGYGAMSALIIASTKSIAAGQYGDHRFKSTDAVQSSAHADILNDSWIMLSVFSIITMAISFIAGFVSLFTEEGERMREEGEAYNYLLTTGWTLLIVSALRVLGNRSFSRSRDISQTEVGFFAGALYFFGAAALLTAGLYGGGGADRGMERPVASLIFVFSCFTFAMAYLAFGRLVMRYYTSILHVNGDEVVSEYVAMPEEPTHSDVINTSFS